MERAALVSRHVELQAIALKSATVTCSADPTSPPIELVVHQGHRARSELSDEHPDRLVVYVDLRFGARPPQVEEVPAEDEAPESQIATLNATYQLHYDLKDAANYPKDALQYFAELNGVYNAWPYWRELVQTVSGRVGLGSFIMPVFRPEAKPIEPAEMVVDEAVQAAAPTTADAEDGNEAK
jgi:hypothetical protein